MRPDAAVELRRGYLSAVTFMDSQLGRVLDALDDLKLANDTVVIFTSDHGYGLGERGHWGKGSLYEIDARVPLIVRDPHQPAAVWESNIQPDFNVRVIERFGPDSFVVLRELDESHRFVQKSAESTSI